MTLYLVKSTVDTSTLTAVDQPALDLKGALDQLVNGSTLYVSNYLTNGTAQSNLFVKLDTNQTTVVAYYQPTTNTTWLTYPVAINAFVYNPTYVYDASTYQYNTFVSMGTVVKYQNAQGEVDSAIVQGILVDSKGYLYYKLSGDTNIYQLMKDSTEDPDIPALVTDPHDDWHMVPVSADPDIWVMI